ncbi:SWIM zinc finger family protein [Halonotius sp. GCM10025705]|uniref:SWIM zinc finger family protein n=1 Tax=Halonotius sp. GCM10025705 TaxID=3252678 RepID=UPI003623801D
MEDTQTPADKTAVDELNFGAKTAKRVGWEQFEFAIESPHLVRVTNASYGYEKDDHSYLVGVEDRGGLLVPAECDCPADKYNEEYDCKHKVALATIGGSVVMEAAVEQSTPTMEAGEHTSTTLAERMRPDGGVIVEEDRGDDTRLIESQMSDCPNDEKFCSGPNGDSLPCFACFSTTE